MTTLCSPSQRAFIPSRDIRNNIVLVNSLIDGNTDGVIMMLDWAKAYDSVDHEYLEKVLFYMGCSGIGLQRLMSTAKGFTLRVIGSQSVSEPFNRERGVGQGCPLAPLLFALAIEPLSRMLKQTMSGMHIDRIHAQQDTTRTVVAMCADDTTIFAGGLDDIAHAKEAIQCYMDASSASINWDKTTSFLCGSMAQDPPPPDVIPGTILGPKDKTRYLGAIISRDPNVAPWENALAKALTRLKAWSKRNLSIHNRALIVRTMILPTVDYVLSAAPAPSRALCLLERNITEFLWNDPDGNRRRPMVDCATLARPHNRGGLNCPLVKDIADSRRVALWMRALYSTEDWACALKKRVLDETGANATAFLHKRISDTNHAQQIIAAFKRLRWAYPDYAIPQGLKRFERLLTRRGRIIPCGDDRLETQPTPPPRYANGLLNDTHLMFKYPPFLVDANKWCDNKVETRDVHCALKPLYGSQRRTQIVASVSKVAWKRVRRMPSDQTRNHAWRVAHQISLRTQQTDRCKCGKRMTVDDVHFECRFVKPLWSIIAQANRLTVNGIDTTNTTPIS